jgi:hypothetical protein
MIGRDERPMGRDRVLAIRSPVWIVPHSLQRDRVCPGLREQRRAGTRAVPQLKT